MKNSHRRFDVLCVLASCGQLSDRQLEKLFSHAANCDRCRKRFDEMAALSGSLWTAATETRRMAVGPNGMTERFVARAIREGVPLHPPKRCSSWRLAVVLPTAVLALMVIAILAWKQNHLPRPEYAISVMPVAQRDHNAASFAARRVDPTAETSRKSKPRERTGSYPQERPGDSQPGPSFMSPPRWARAGADLSGMKPAEIESAEIAPALSAWLTRMNPLAELRSFNSHNACDGRGMQSSREYGEGQARPVFCFDPEITLVADSNAPDLFKPSWRRAAEPERIPMFRFADANRQIIH